MFTGTIQIPENLTGLAYQHLVQLTVDGINFEVSSVVIQ